MIVSTNPGASAVRIVPAGEDDGRIGTECLAQPGPFEHVAVEPDDDRPDRAPRYQEEMAKAYVRMDTIVGEARAALPADAVLPG